MKITLRRILSANGSTQELGFDVELCDQNEVAQFDIEKYVNSLHRLGALTYTPGGEDATYMEPKTNPVKAYPDVSIKPLNTSYLTKTRR